MVPETKLIIKHEKQASARDFFRTSRILFSPGGSGRRILTFQPPLRPSRGRRNAHFSAPPETFAKTATEKHFRTLIYIIRARVRGHRGEQAAKKGEF